MQKDFWHKAWQEGRIGFHRGDFHPLLMEHFPELELSSGAHVLVPLCGKSLDLLWLAKHGHQVTGVELSEIAARAFFEENKIAMTESKRGGFQCFKGDNVKILCGDFFELTPDLIDSVDAIYDRAAMIALPPELRERYYQKIHDLMPKNSKKLLITLEYDQDVVHGPPFSVTEQEVREAFHAHKIELLHSEAIDIDNQKFKDAGLFKVIQKTWVISRS